MIAFASSYEWSVRAMSLIEFFMRGSAFSLVPSVLFKESDTFRYCYGCDPPNLDKELSRQFVVGWNDGR